MIKEFSYFWRVKRQGREDANNLLNWVHVDHSSIFSEKKLCERVSTFVVVRVLNSRLKVSVKYQPTTLCGVC